MSEVYSTCWVHAIDLRTETSHFRYKAHKETYTAGVGPRSIKLERVFTSKYRTNAVDP